MLETILVEWEDTYTRSAWLEEGEFPSFAKTRPLVHTVGFKISSNKDALIVAGCVRKVTLIKKVGVKLPFNVKS